MSSIQKVIDAISYLQVNIPEDLYRLKQNLQEVSEYENDPYVLGIIKKNKKLE